MKTTFKAFLLLSLVLLFSCNKDSTEPIQEPKFIIEEAYPGITGEIVEFIFDADTIYCEKINGEYVFQGDIILTEDQLGIKAGLKAARFRYFTKKWPNNKVFYRINDNVTAYTDIIQEAIDHWEKYTNIRFEYAESVTPNFVEFIGVNEGYSSKLGMIPGGQLIRFDGWVEKGILIHEIGHAIGLIHEHSRNDRDNVIDVHEENILAGKEGQFKKYKFTVNTEKFDIQSIMMYGSWAFSKDKDGKFDSMRTITSKSGYTIIPQRDNLTSTDIEMVNLMYPSSSPEPVAYYPFNGDPKDGSGNGHDGIANGPTLTTDRHGNEKSAYSFDGVDDEIVVKNSPDFNLLNGFTFSAWIKANSWGEASKGFILCRRVTHTSVNGGYIFGFNPSLFNIHYVTVDGEIGAQINHQLDDTFFNEFHFVATTFDGQVLKLYIDGELVGSVNSTGTIAPTDIDLVIGNTSAQDQVRTFDGIIDEIRIYNKMLTENEILNLYQDE